MNITFHKMPMILSTLVLVMGLLYACPTDTPTLKAGDITYDKDSIAQGTAGTATPSSATITDFSTLKFSIAPIGTHTGEQVPPAIDAEDGTITTTATTSAGSYRVTITPDGSIFTGTLTVDFYVTIKAATLGDLDTKLQQAITDYGRTGDFNYIDTSEVTDMSYLFAPAFTPGSSPPEVDSTRDYVKNFNGDISKWDVSAVTNFGGVFLGATAFNQDISEWTVTAGKEFISMFQGAVVFNQNISRWTVTAGENFVFMFFGATAFTQDISGWDLNPESVTMTGMFANSGVANPPFWYPQQ